MIPYVTNSSCLCAEQATTPIKRLTCPLHKGGKTGYGSKLPKCVALISGIVPILATKYNAT